MKRGWCTNRKIGAGTANATFITEKKMGTDDYGSDSVMVGVSGEISEHSRVRVISAVLK